MARIRIAELAEYTQALLEEWTFADRKASVSTHVKDLVTARVDANAALIDEKMQFYCNLYQMSRSDLRQKIREASEAGISFVALRKQLAEEARSRGVQVQVDEPDGDE